MTTEWTLTDAEDGLTALEVMQERVPAAPTAYLRQLLRGGKVRRPEDTTLPEDAVLRAGQRLILPASRRLEELIAASPAGSVHILFESRELLVVFKPAGLAIHRGEGHEEDNLQRRVQDLMERRRAPFTVAPIHRLDAETSGPVLFGKGKKAAGEMGKIFMTDQVEKVYVALAAGEFSGTGLFTAPVAAKGKQKEAKTAYRVLAHGRGFSLLELRLFSGRTHQIRRHLADAGHPLAGDRRYGGPALHDLRRLFLHCWRLALPDPFGDSPLTIESPLPEELDSALRSLGLHFPAKNQSTKNERSI
jgi:RluA family pseudouridine synthase